MYPRTPIEDVISFRETGILPLPHEINMKPTPRWIPLPLYIQVLIAVTGGVLFGMAFGQEPYLGCLRTLEPS